MLFLQLFLLDGGSRAQLVFFFIIRLSHGCQSAHRNSQQKKKQQASKVASAIQRRFIIDLHEIIVEDDDVGGDITEQPHVHLFLFLSSITRAVSLRCCVFCLSIGDDDKVKRSVITSNFNIPLFLESQTTETFYVTARQRCRFVALWHYRVDLIKFYCCPWQWAVTMLCMLSINPRCREHTATATLTHSNETSQVAKKNIRENSFSQDTFR